MITTIVIVCWLCLIGIFVWAWARSRALGLDAVETPVHEEIPSEG